MGADFYISPPQKSRFFAISPQKVDFKKSVKYISAPELTLKGARGLRRRSAEIDFCVALSAA
jgi:hypothetical protein